MRYSKMKTWETYDSALGAEIALGVLGAELRVVARKAHAVGAPPIDTAGSLSLLRVQVSEATATASRLRAHAGRDLLREIAGSSQLACTDVLIPNARKTILRDLADSSLRATLDETDLFAAIGGWVTRLRQLLDPDALQALAKELNGLSKAPMVSGAAVAEAVEKALVSSAERVDSSN